MKTIIRSFLICVTFGALCALNVSCTKQLRTVVIKPDSKRFYYYTKKADEATTACLITACFHSHGTSCDPQLTADDSTIVGYSHTYDPGTQPCPCWWYVNCAYRGYVGFNASTLPQTGIVSATLKWDPSTVLWIGDTAAATGNCIYKIYRATEQWQTGRVTAGEEISWEFTGEANSKPGEINVSQTVRGWLNGTQPNYGFFFVGPNENVDERNNNRCLTTMINLRLEVITAAPSWPQ
jgi:hypothetical protein